jgi:hypothetical protein
MSLYLVVILSAIILECHHAECFYTECHHAECCYSECHYTKCRYVECHHTERCGCVVMLSVVILSFIMLIIITLTVVILSVVILTVVAKKCLTNEDRVSDEEELIKLNHFEDEALLRLQLEVAGSMLGSRIQKHFFFLADSLHREY